MLYTNGTVRIDYNSVKELANQIGTVIESNVCRPDEINLVIDVLESLIGTLTTFKDICYDLLQGD